MHYLVQRLRRRSRGFTLIELIVVMAIIAILALIAVPRLTKFREQAISRRQEANARIAFGAAAMVVAEHGAPEQYDGLGDIVWPDGWQTGVALSIDGIPVTNARGEQVIGYGWGAFLEKWPEAKMTVRIKADGDIEKPLFEGQTANGGPTQAELLALLPDRVTGTTAGFAFSAADGFRSITVSTIDGADLTIASVATSTHWEVLPSGDNKYALPWRPPAGGAGANNNRDTLMTVRIEQDGVTATQVYNVFISRTGSSQVMLTKQNTPAAQALLALLPSSVTGGTADGFNVQADGNRRITVSSIDGAELYITSVTSPAATNDDSAHWDMYPAADGLGKTARPSRPTTGTRTTTMIVTITRDGVWAQQVYNVATPTTSGGQVTLTKQ